MAYRTSKPLHPTEFGDPDKKGTTGMKGTTGVRGSTTKTGVTGSTTKRGVTGAVGTRGSGSGKNPKLQAFQTVKVPSSRTPHSRTGVTGTAHKYSFTGIAHNKSTCTHCNPPKKKLEKLVSPPKAKKLSYYTPSISVKKTMGFIPTAPKKVAPKKVTPTKAAPKKPIYYTKKGKKLGASGYYQGMGPERFKK